MAHKTPPNAQKGTKVKIYPAWAVMDKKGPIELSLDRFNLPQPGRGEKLVRVKVSV